MSELLRQNTNTEVCDAIAPGAKQGPVVRILGTLPATWLPIAQALQQVLEASGATVASISQRGPTGGHDGAGTAPTADIVAFIDSPARVLGQWVASGDSGSVPHVLETWRRSAMDLLKLVHRSAGHCLLIDVAEASTAPDKLLHALTGWHVPLRTMQFEFTPPSSPDALCMALARHLCSADLESAALFDELHAASIAIPDSADAAASAHTAPDAAVHRYRALLATERGPESTMPSDTRGDGSASGAATVSGGGEDLGQAR